MSKDSRKKLVVQRLRRRLQAKSESLADQFQFRVYVGFIFKDSSKPPVIYRSSDVVPVMTNNYEQDIIKAAQESHYSMENGKQLLEADFVQLHTTGYCHVNGGNVATESPMNFLIWPRSDIASISCAVFSRWRKDNSPFQHVQQDFSICSSSYQRQIAQRRRSNVKEMVINDSRQSMFMLVNNHAATEQRAEYSNLSGLCLFLPQAKLMCWDMTTEEEIMQSFAVT